MTSTRNKFLLALVALVLLATYAAAVKGDCTVENCATCLEEDATKCAECKPGYKRNRRRPVRGDLLPRTARCALKRTPPSARTARRLQGDRRRHVRGGIGRRCGPALWRCRGGSTGGCCGGLRAVMAWVSWRGEAAEERAM
nr:unnamed protein product [Leishmania braziliensis]